jgi:O-antigen/teichoic acid export membrane protein
MLVARRDFRELDRMYFRLTAISIGALALGALAAELLVGVLYAGQYRLAHRLLPPLPTGIFLLAILLYQLPQCQHIYLRAHKREPLLVATIIASLSIGLLVWTLGVPYGPTGAACGYLAVVALFILPCKTYLWWRCRREWHA